MVAPTEVRPRNSGTPAATMAPKASSRMSSVPPNENCMDFASSAASVADEGMALGRAAVLLDAQLGMSLLDRGDRGERGLGRLDELGLVLVGVGQAEVDDHGAAVLGDGVVAIGLVQRAVDVGDAVDALEALHGVLDGRGHLRIVGLDRALALDQDLLADGLGEVGGLHDLHGALGLAVAHLSRRQVLLADALAGEGGEDDEEDPSEDGGLSVLRAPTSGASSQVAWGVHARQCPSGAPALPTGHPASVGAARDRARGRRPPARGAGSTWLLSGWPQVAHDDGERVVGALAVALEHALGQLLGCDAGLQR